MFMHTQIYCKNITTHENENIKVIIVISREGDEWYTGGFNCIIRILFMK